MTYADDGFSTLSDIVAIIGKIATAVCRLRVCVRELGAGEAERTQN